MTDDAESLRAQVASLRRQVIEQQVEIETLKAQLARQERIANRDKRWLRD